MRLRSRLSTVAFLCVLALASSCDGGGGFQGEIQFEGEQAFLPGFEQDTGWIPAVSPASLRVVARAGGGVSARARATSDGTAMTGVPGSGELATSGELTLEVSARINTSGFDYEGVVDSFGYAITPGMATFDPFLLDSDARVVSELPPAELARAPIPSVPGATLIINVTGGSLTTVFRGTCATTADGVGHYMAETTTSGTIELSGTIEIEVPIVGTETFGPFPFSVEVPALGSPLDLGMRSLSTGEAVDRAAICGAAPMTDGGTTPDGGTPPDGGTAPLDGGSCVDLGGEPNDTEASAEMRVRDGAFDCDHTDSMSGTLDGPSDVDWFRVPAVDTEAGGCAHVASSSAAGVRVCIFGECVLGDAPVATCELGTPETSPDGLPGCCDVGSSPSLLIECEPGASTLTYMLVRVDQGSECLDYSLDYLGAPL